MENKLVVSVCGIVAFKCLIHETGDFLFYLMIEWTTVVSLIDSKFDDWVSNFCSSDWLKIGYLDNSMTLQ